MGIELLFVLNFELRRDASSSASPTESFLPEMTVLNSKMTILTFPSFAPLDAEGHGHVAFPEHGEQRAELTVKGKGVEILVRMGPFDKDSTLFCTVNGKDVPFEREIIGLSAWLRVKLEAKEKEYVILAREQ